MRFHRLFKPKSLERNGFAQSFATPYGGLLNPEQCKLIPGGYYPPRHRIWRSIISTSQPRATDVEIDLHRDLFLRDLLHHLSGTLQDVVGIEQAAGFVSVVGRAIGENINDRYKHAIGVERLSRQQVAEVLVDLKQRIQGNFRVVEEDDDRLVLETTSCPFEDRVIGRPSLCMMTSNVFGTIASDNLGYAKVVLEDTIANGAQGCRVVVYLREDGEASEAEGIEYFGGFGV